MTSILGRLFDENTLISEPVMVKVKVIVMVRVRVGMKI
jgi:hypothetical protein